MALYLISTPHPVRSPDRFSLTAAGETIVSLPFTHPASLKPAGTSRKQILSFPRSCLRSLPDRRLESLSARRQIDRRYQASPVTESIPVVICWFRLRRRKETP